MRPSSKFVWTSYLFVFALLHATAHAQGRERASSVDLTCDATELDPDSYALTVRAQADIVTGTRSSWWDGFFIGRHAADLADLNVSAKGAAEYALRLDPRNLLAHSILARQYVLLGEDGAIADQFWRAALDSGGEVVWTATLYDVDARSYFVVAFGRKAFRVFRYGELAGPFDTSMGRPQFVGADRERFWRAWGGCIDSMAAPEAVVPWGDVHEIKAGNWVLYFKLSKPVTIRSDRGKRKTLREIKVNLHGATGTVEVLTSRDVSDPSKVSVRPMGIGPLGYQQRVRYTLVKHVDPVGHIKLPKASRSAGW